MKRLISSAFLILLIIQTMAYAQPFGPPIYIADPVEMECRYYFAGNERHFNPRPDNYTIDIGYTTDFKSQDQACEFWRCIYTNGTVKVNPDNRPIEKDICLCNPGHYWDDVKGCVKFRNINKEKTFLGLIFGWIMGIFG